eukprot:CAMPEP_0113874880 /NCGR_PEP_ID=MMETSP0780_2-20120614/4599_1 /TAXON_ID=652834 /ORGANISM="Palpitomonas bilix" /LENGTH=247 /DNA_ID=CAMNT_0000860741 /DNA_START=152 /DNA_END=895 /DNA_ORIENTATION=+ /assembly_acc=CAM_ASM_000599
MARPLRFVLLGDSLTEYSFRTVHGWGPRLAVDYSRKADVIPRAFGGYTTRAFLYYIDKILSSCPPPDVATLCLGGNDAALPGTTGGYHVPVQEMKENTAKIIKEIKKRNEDTKIILLTPSIADDEVAAEYCLREFDIVEGGWKLEYGKQYADAAQAVAQDLDLPYINFWRDMQNPTQSPFYGNIRDVVQPDFRRYVYDGMHLSTAGHSFVYKSLKALIRRDLPEFCSDSLPVFMPIYQDIDWSSPPE